MAQSAPASEFLKNPRNQVILVVGVIVLVLIVVGIIFAMSNNSGSSSTSSGTGGTGQAMSDTPGATSLPGGGSTGGTTPGIPGDTGTVAAGAPMTGNPGGGAGSPTPGGAPAGAPAAAGEKAKMPAREIPSRRDPFQYNGELERVFQEMVANVPPDLTPIPNHIEQWWELYKPPTRKKGSDPADVEPQLPVPPMRVAGIHNGTVVAAMLEVRGQVLPEMAIPGRTIQIDSEQFRVERVDRDGVVLSRSVPNYNKRQRIEVGLESATAGFGAGGGAAAPTYQGMPGSGGFPGSGGGRPGGKLGGVGGGPVGAGKD